MIAPLTPEGNKEGVEIIISFEEKKTKRKMKRHICLLLIALSASSMVLAQQVITVEQCRDMALQHNKDRRSAMLTSRQADYTLRSTRALFFPDFSLSALGMYDTGAGTLGYDLTHMKGVLAGTVQDAFTKGILSPTGAKWLNGVGSQLPDKVDILDYKLGWMFSANLVMKQPLYMGGKIRAGYAMAKTGVEMARQNERKTDAEVIMAANEAYANCVKAQELRVVAEKYKSLLTELEKNVKSAVKYGLKMQNDVMKVQVKLNEVELQIKRAENANRLAMMNLCHVIGQPLTSQYTVTSTYPVVSDVQALSSDDVYDRPEYALLDCQAQMAAEQVKMTRSDMLPRVALMAKYGYDRGMELNDRLLLHDWNFAGGVTVSVPVYHFGERTNKVKAAKVKQELAELDRDNKAELMTLELTRAANNLEEAQLEVELADRSLGEAEENMRLSKHQYDVGKETLSDYLEAQAIWQKAYQTKIDANFQLYLSSVSYLKAAGRLVEP